MSYIAQGLNNYTKTYSNKRTGFSVGYYTVSQVKALYPQGDYQVAAQIGAGVKKMRRIRWPTMENRTGRSLQEKSAASHGWLYQLRRKAVCRGEEEHCLAMDFAADPFAGADFGIQYAANHWDEMFPDQPAAASTDPKGQVDQNIVEGDITLSTKKKLIPRGKPSNCRALPQ